jgi:hypothetical protein
VLVKNIILLTAWLSLFGAAGIFVGLLLHRPNVVEISSLVFLGAVVVCSGLFFVHWLKKKL